MEFVHANVDLLFPQGRRRKGAPELAHSSLDAACAGVSIVTCAGDVAVPFIPT